MDEDVIEGAVLSACRARHHTETLNGEELPGEILKSRRAQSGLKGTVLLLEDFLVGAGAMERTYCGITGFHGAYYPSQDVKQDEHDNLDDEEEAD
jgi:hypothetical protein